MAKGAILGQETNTDELENKFNSYLPLSGGTMMGNIDMGNKKITNLLDPTNDNDAVNYKTLNGSNYSNIPTMKFLGRGYIPGASGPSRYTITTPNNDLAIVIYPLVSSGTSVQSLYLYKRNTNKYTFTIGNKEVYIQRTSGTNVEISYPGEKLFFELYELSNIG